MALIDCIRLFVMSDEDFNRRYNQKGDAMAVEVEGQGRRQPSRARAKRSAQDILGGPIVIFDTETTGIGNDAEIVEIACIDGGGEVLLWTKVKPVGNIPASATAIHGITDDDVRDAPTIIDLMPQLTKIWTQAGNGRAVYAYNLGYDARLLHQSFAAHGEEWPFTHEVDNDLMRLYAEFHGEWSRRHGNYIWQSLGKAMDQCNLEFEGDAHSALADSKASLAVLFHMATTELAERQ